jgi:hypothetical protein
MSKKSCAKEALQQTLWQEKYHKIGNKLAAYEKEGVTHLSFEFFPPNTPIGVKNLLLRIKKLQVCSERRYATRMADFPHGQRI